MPENKGTPMNLCETCRNSREVKYTVDEGRSIIEHSCTKKLPQGASVRVLECSEYLPDAVLQVHITSYDPDHEPYGDWYVGFGRYLTDEMYSSPEDAIEAVREYIEKKLVELKEQKGEERNSKD